METAAPQLPARTRRRLALQRVLARAVSPITVVAVSLILRVWLRLRLAGAAEARRAYAGLCREPKSPLLICANHLTLIDSALIAWALGSPGWYLRHFRTLPWNVPDQQNFASTPIRRALAYLYKCVPIPRGGDRGAVAEVLARFSHLLRIGDVGLIFPEGGRSRSGRVEVEHAAYGVGRIVRSVPDCRVLCVYLRGERQHRYSNLPARGDRLRVSTSLLEPKSDRGGLRGSLEVARQITARLAEMEREQLDVAS